jgi:thioester reductase-like protein
MDTDDHNSGIMGKERPDESAIDRGASAIGAGTLLLTGGTGALGRVLIREVIQESEARILTVVRRSRAADPEERLRLILRDEGVADEVGGRIGVIGGNLGIGDFGLLP